MSPLDDESKRVHDVTVEYQVASEHHMHQMGTRFTIAGFYIAAMGFLLQSLVSDTSNLGTRLITCALGFILTLPIWILELRTRQLIRLYARRMVQIEYDYLGIQGGDGYTGVMSQIYESPPPRHYDSANQDPIRSLPYRARFAWMKKPFRPSLGNFVSHSMGFDLLYLFCLIFWIGVAIYFVSTRPALPDVQTIAYPITSPILLPTPISTYTPIILNMP